MKRLSRHMQKVSNEKFDLIELDEGRRNRRTHPEFQSDDSEDELLINNVYKLEIQKKSLEMERVRAELNFCRAK